ncbi:MAG: DUF6491 family protein [Gammaproteobacteria bacterium]|nr:DUF6491 family protein [Gammaproteobacteria bacterium]HJM09059.1 DUF6491 family protein [Gammaproteobacteria bacterium]HJN00147.1 DUF6491 family protein [Gammaproteobacteria bacterium]
MIILNVLVIGCTTDDELSGKNSSLNTNKRASCFNTASINDYEVLDRGNLIVYGRPRKRAYHLQISPANLDLGGSDMISFRSWTGRVCGYAGDELIIPNDIFQPRYSIVSVTELDEMGLYNLMVQFGKAEPLDDIEPEVSGEPEISRELDNENEEGND